MASLQTWENGMATLYLTEPRSLVRKDGDTLLVHIPEDEKRHTEKRQVRVPLIKVTQVVVYGEIFQNKKEIGWALPGFSNNARLMREFHQEPVRFVERRVFKKFQPRIRAVGFKIFYYHAQDEAWAPVWGYLRQHREIKVLHTAQILAGDARR